MRVHIWPFFCSNNFFGCFCLKKTNVKSWRDEGLQEQYLFWYVGLEIAIVRSWYSGGGRLWAIVCIREQKGRRHWELKKASILFQVQSSAFVTLSGVTHPMPVLWTNLWVSPPLSGLWATARILAVSMGSQFWGALSAAFPGTQWLTPELLFHYCPKTSDLGDT